MFGLFNRNKPIKFRVVNYLEHELSEDGLKKVYKRLQNIVPTHTPTPPEVFIRAKVRGGGVSKSIMRLVYQGIPLSSINIYIYDYTYDGTRVTLGSFRLTPDMLRK